MSELQSILLAEDDPDIAILAQIALEEIGGFAFQRFETGEQLLAAAVARPPDLIMLDYRMPGMNGAEVFAELRATHSVAAVPVIFMTASLMPAHVRKLIDLGALDVIAKPFDPLTLAARVEKVWKAAA
jgi:DNA-binding response OmpR family regulator